MPTEAIVTTAHSANGAAHRFPGTRPFADSALERRLFFGRSAEASDLFHQILSADLLVLYGKSGLGKTSLLQAGIFPRLRQRGFLPLLVRLNRPEAPLLQTTIFDIEKSCRDQQIDYSPGDTTGLWQFFKTAIFWRDGDLQTPVLVFDQFEELFTLYAPEQRQAFAMQLGELVKSGLPSSIRAQREKGEPLVYSERQPAIKVILAFRESYLGELQALAYEIPKVMENRFRLLSMDRVAARQAIVEPALLAEEKALVSPTFNFSEDALEEMLGFLAGQKGDIEPFALQLLCSHVERELVPTKAKMGRRDITITAAELGGHQGMGAVMRTFYAARIAQLPGYWQRKRARRLCAYGLLTSDGRRVSLEEGQILNEYDVSKQTLSQLASDSVLRKTPDRAACITS